MKKSRLRLEFYIIISIVVLGFAYFVIRLVLDEKREALPMEAITIAVCKDYYVEDFDTNYYTIFLEEKTGYDIDFVYIDEGLEEEYINTVLNLERGSVDAILLPSNEKIISDTILRQYVDDGLICSIDNTFTGVNNLKNLRNEYPDIDYSKIIDDNGLFFAFPYIDLSAKAKNLQIMWINVDWLKKFDLSIPKTTEELEKCLRAFKDLDPNEDGINDEIPILSVSDNISNNSEVFLKNAFTYYNPILEKADSQSALALANEYIERLKKDELIVSLDCDGAIYEMREIINSPKDLIGIFASNSISNVIYADNPEVMDRFIQLPPISAVEGQQGFAVVTEPCCEIGGFIPANAKHKQEAAAIMDLMLATESGLVAKYGEELIDWHRSNDGEFTPFGMRAVISTENYLDGVVQNKNYSLTGPFVLDSEYLDYVTWNGEHSFFEYKDICAVNIYEKYYKK